MNQVSRRQAIGFGLATIPGLSAVTGSARAQAPRGPDDVTEHAMTFKLKNVVIDRIDESGRTVSVSLLERKKPAKLVDIPLAKEIKVVWSHVFPSVGNNLPFDWSQVKNLLGKTVSMRMRAEGGDIAIISICAGSD